ncbi:uncharacterized protein LOC115770476 [Drosophila novamexicana]|uniref:uncharacterized protein LOC115770476 n=1 Tax=Drosophila novamexicana TaxID=47314 RepID=UPI0011E5B737|nr:uncharacterized protein LOC115770476 [Drosophila novamexicana]
MFRLEIFFKRHSKLFRVIHVLKINQNTHKHSFRMIQTEDRELDRALELCKLIQSDLRTCVNIVQRLDHRYNEPDRERTVTKPIRSDIVGENSSLSAISLVRSSNTSLSTFSLVSDGTNKVEGRTSHELNYIFVDLTSKAIRVRRDLETATAHTQRITDCSMRQEPVQHRMLRDARGSKTFICKHYNTKTPKRGSSKKTWRLRDYIDVPMLGKQTIQMTLCR